MALKFKSLVKEVSTAGFSGTGPFTLGGVPAGEPWAIAFIDAVGNGGKCEYVARSSNGQWQRSKGTVTAGSPVQLSRDSVLENSLGTTAQIDFASATLDIYIVNMSLPELADADAGKFLRLAAGAQAYDFAETPFPPGHINGLIPSNATDADHDITFTPGTARHADDSGNFRLAAADLTKRADAAFSEGGTAASPAGGLGDTVTLPASGTIHAIAITKDADGAADVYFDTDIGGANAPSGWTVRRRLASFFTDASNNLRPFRTVATAGGGVRIFYTAPPQDVNDAATGTAEKTATLSVPAGLSLVAMISGFADTNARQVYVHHPAVTDQATDPTAGRMTVGGTSASGAGARVEVETDTARQIQYRASNNGAFYLMTLGYVDERRAA